MDEHPAFRAAVERRVAQYDYKRVARVPLDFAEEVLPAEAGDPEAVGPDQVDEVLDAREPRAPAQKRQRPS